MAKPHHFGLAPEGGGGDERQGFHASSAVERLAAPPNGALVYTQLFGQALERRTAVFAQ